MTRKEPLTPRRVLVWTGAIFGILLPFIIAIKWPWLPPWLGIMFLIWPFWSIWLLSTADRLAPPRQWVKVDC